MRAPRYDAVIVGSGVGGAMAAHVLVEAGLRVLMLERGPRVTRGPENGDPGAALELSPYYSHESALVVRGDDRGSMGTLQVVGGPAVFYGGVALRLRESDFAPAPEALGPEAARWPIEYDDLEPFYGRAERLFGVAGREYSDDPWRSSPYPMRAPDIRGPTRRLWRAASSLGLHPRHLPLAIDFEGASGPACERCGNCDAYACAVGAKREPASALVPALEAAGLELRPETVVTRLLRRGTRVVGVVCVDRVTGRSSVVRGDYVVLAAGALGSPHIVRASGVDARSPAREWVGRGLMRHSNGIVFGLFPQSIEGARAFHKQMVLFDLYADEAGAPLGSIQSIHPPPPGLVRARLPRVLHALPDWIADRSTGLLVVAEDQPRPENRVEPHPSRTDRFGVPRLVVTHRHTWRDAVVRRDLGRVARAVLRQAGAIYTQGVRIKTFSHALGTLRMGDDPRGFPSDRHGRLRGVENVWVVDGSTIPRSGGVNPSLTIAANALRIAEGIAHSNAPRSRAAARCEAVR